YLTRRLFREGAHPSRPWFRLHYPVHSYYDLLVGLDVLTSLGSVGRSANPSVPRPPHRDAKPRRELEHGCIASGLGRPRVPIPGTVLSAWLGGGWTPKPMDYDDGPHGLEENGRGLRRRDEGRVMPRAGLEPATSRSSVSHSPKLSYRGSRGP